MKAKKISMLFAQYSTKPCHIVKAVYEYAKTSPYIIPYKITTEDWANNKHIELAKEHPEIDAFFIPFRGKQELEKILPLFPNVKWIQSSGIGVDYFFHLSNEFKKRNIIFTNTRGSSSILLSEFAVLGALYFAKQTSFFVKSAQNKQWVSKMDKITSLEKKKGLVIGLGNIGGEIARKFHNAFDMEMFGINKENSVPEHLKNAVTLVKFDQIEELVPQMDYLIFSMPGVKIDPILTKDLVKKMKKGVIIINVGRGNVLQEDAIFWGIKEGIIQGAALDVWNKEPLDISHPFFQDSLINEKILNFCHQADSSEFMADIRVRLFEKILKSYLEGKPINVVNWDLGFQLI